MSEVLMRVAGRIVPEFEGARGRLSPVGKDRLRELRLDAEMNVIVPPAEVSGRVVMEPAEVMVDMSQLIMDAHRYAQRAYQLALLEALSVATAMTPSRRVADLLAWCSERIGRADFVGERLVAVCNLARLLAAWQAHYASMYIAGDSEGEVYIAGDSDGEEH